MACSRLTPMVEDTATWTAVCKCGARHSTASAIRRQLCWVSGSLVPTLGPLAIARLRMYLTLHSRLVARSAHRQLSELGIAPPLKAARRLPSTAARRFRRRAPAVLRIPQASMTA